MGAPLFVRPDGGPVSKSGFKIFIIAFHAHICSTENGKMNVGSLSFWKLIEVAVCAVHKFGGDTDQKQCTEEGNRGVRDEMGSYLP